MAKLVLKQSVKAHGPLVFLSSIIEHLLEGLMGGARRGAGGARAFPLQVFSNTVVPLFYNTLS